MALPKHETDDNREPAYKIDREKWNDPERRKRQLEFLDSLLDGSREPNELADDANWAEFVEILNEGRDPDNYIIIPDHK